MDDTVFDFVPVAGDGAFAEVEVKAPKVVYAKFTDAAQRVLTSLAQDIQDLTAAGPGKVTQAQLDALHVKAQRLLELR